MFNQQYVRLETPIIKSDIINSYTSLRALSLFPLLHKEKILSVSVCGTLVAITQPCGVTILSLAPGPDLSVLAFVPVGGARTAHSATLTDDALFVLARPVQRGLEVAIYRYALDQLHHHTYARRLPGLGAPTAPIHVTGGMLAVTGSSGALPMKPTPTAALTIFTPDIYATISTTGDLALRTPDKILHSIILPVMQSTTAKNRPANWPRKANLRAPPAVLGAAQFRAHDTLALDRPLLIRRGGGRSLFPGLVAGWGGDKAIGEAKRIEKTTKITKEQMNMTRAAVSGGRAYAAFGSTTPVSRSLEDVLVPKDDPIVRKLQSNNEHYLANAQIELVDGSILVSAGGHLFRWILPDNNDPKGTLIHVSEAFDKQYSEFSFIFPNRLIIFIPCSTWRQSAVALNARDAVSIAAPTSFPAILDIDEAVVRSDADFEPWCTAAALARCPRAALARPLATGLPGQICAVTMIGEYVLACDDCGFACLYELAPSEVPRFPAPAPAPQDSRIGEWELLDAFL